MYYSWIPFGRYRWLQLPFAVSSAPELFARKIQEIVQDLKGVEVLADDIRVYGSGSRIEDAMEDHSENLKKLLIQLEQKNCKINKDKLKLCQSSVPFLGNVLTNQGFRPDPSKTEAVSKMAISASKTELLWILGMITYLGPLIKDLATETKNLRRLTRDDVKWN